MLYLLIQEALDTEELVLYFPKCITIFESINQSIRDILRLCNATESATTIIRMKRSRKISIDGIATIGI